MGMVREAHWARSLEGAETIGLRSDKIARLGIGYVPEERGIFASLNVART
jgi:branched-chain amino acid transport system ATP-binding protein